VLPYWNVYDIHDNMNLPFALARAGGTLLNDLLFHPLTVPAAPYQFPLSHRFLISKSSPSFRQFFPVH